MFSFLSSVNQLLAPWRLSPPSLAKAGPGQQNGVDASATCEPRKLAAACAPICDAMLRGLNYPGTPSASAESVERLLKYMHRRALEMGVALDNPRSKQGFRLGLSLGLLAHPNHPVEVQGYVGLVSWLVVQYDDIVGQNNEMIEAAQGFNSLFFAGRPQPHPLLEGLATLIREAGDHFDPVLANLLQISMLKFLTANLLERHDGFQSLQITQGAGEPFPYFLRDMSGIDVAYSVFCFPKAQYPDVSQFLEAIPDIAKIINISNDVISFYKEELQGEKRNYIHDRATATGKPVMVVVKEVADETVACAERVRTILGGRGKYLQTWEEHIRGLTAMHTVNVRYKMGDMGLGEEHPLAPFDDKIAHIFEQI